MRPVISVITPSYNQGRFIEETIQSVLHQRIASLEYFVVDGGSNDGTVTILRRYSRRLRWVSEKDKGQADAINKGIKATTGDIVGYLNSDDIYYPGALRAVLRFFEEHPETDVVYGDADHIDLHGTVIEPYYTEDWDYQRLKEVCYLCQPAVFFRRRLIMRAGMFDAGLRYCMDYEYWLRLGAITPFTRLHQKLAGSRMHQQNKTLGSTVAVHCEINNMLRKRIGTVPQRWIFNYAHAVIDQKGFIRTNPIEDFKYVSAVISVSILSFLRWTHSLPRDALITMGKWAIASLVKMIGTSGK